MSRRATGAVFIAISAFLYGIRYIAAALFGSTTTNWNEEMFNILLTSVGTRFNSFSLLALLVGIAYLIWAEIEEYIKKK